MFSKYSTRLSYINVSPFHLGPATTLASLLLARAILQIFEATLYEFLDPWILLFLFKMAEPRRPIGQIFTIFTGRSAEAGLELTLSLTKELTKRQMSHLETQDAISA